MTKAGLLLFTGLATITATQAWAQGAGPAPAPAAPAPAAFTTIDEVVVTARRREESLQDVPISVTAVSGEQLLAQGVDKIENLATPSLTITTGGTNRKTAAFSLRGQRTNESQLLTDPPVGTYFAEVVQPRPFGFGYTLYDIANVQVLKGVQGTLFGRNMTGGAVLISPAEPSDAFEGYVQGTLGNFDARQLEAMINLPIGDVGSFRLAGRTRQRDGYVTDITSGRDFEDENYDSLRGSLKLAQGSLSNLTTVDWLKADENGSAPIGTDYRTGNLAVVPPGLGCLQAVQTGVLTPFGATECLSRVPGSPIASPIAQYNRSIARLAGGDDLTVAMGSDTSRQNGLGGAFSNLENWGITNRTVLTINDNLQLKNIFGYRKIDFTRLQDLDGVETFFINSIQDTHVEQYSEELQLQGSAFDERLNFTAGAYYFRESGEENSAPSSQFPDLTLGGAAAAGAGNLALSPAFQAQVGSGLAAALVGAGLTPGTPQFQAAFNAQIGPAIGAAVSAAFPAVLAGTYASLQARDFFIYDRGHGVAETYAAYLAGDYKLTDTLSVSGGLRYTQDKREARINPTAARPGGQFICTYDPDGAGPGAALPVNACQRTRSVDNDAVTWDATLQYEPSDSLTAYASVRKGFRSGGFSMRAKSDAAFAAFLPETVQEYEVGVKTLTPLSFGSLRTSAALFFQDYNDVQKQSPALVNGAVVTVITNTTKQENYGGEFELALRLNNGLDVTAFYSNVQAEIKKGGVPGAFVLTGTPENQAGLNISYTPTFFPSEAGELTFNANYSYKSKIHLDDFDRSADQKAYSLLNLRVNWAKVYGSRVDVALWGNNVTDERYRVGVVSLLDSAGTQTGSFGEPRTYGIDLRYSF
jgi:iron complex outermembrane recepter protein